MGRGSADGGTADGGSGGGAAGDGPCGDGSAGRGAGVPDGFHYEITVDGRTAHCAEPDLTDAQRELVSRVLREGA
ncbi:protealysin inhibitor emfourin [Streptomyces kanasensis]